jgi:hypothetical protein
MVCLTRCGQTICALSLQHRDLTLSRRESGLFNTTILPDPIKKKITEDDSFPLQFAEL